MKKHVDSVPGEPVRTADLLQVFASLYLPVREAPLSTTDGLMQIGPESMSAVTRRGLAPEQQRYVLAQMLGVVADHHILGARQLRMISAYRFLATESKSPNLRRPNQSHGIWGSHLLLARFGGAFDEALQADGGQEAALTFVANRAAAPIEAAMLWLATRTYNFDEAPDVWIAEQLAAGVAEATLLPDKS